MMGSPMTNLQVRAMAGSEDARDLILAGEKTSTIIKAGTLNDLLNQGDVIAPHTGARHNKETYNTRHRIENACANLKNSRQFATRHDRRATTFLGAKTHIIIFNWWPISET